MTDIDRLYHKIKSRWNFRRQQADATAEELKFLVELLDEMERDDFAEDIIVSTKWVSVKDRLPEFGEAYYAACRSLMDDRGPWVIEGNYGIETHFKPWGVPLISWGKAEVYAWQPKVYPEPPKEDAEDDSN